MVPYYNKYVKIANLDEFRVTVCGYWAVQLKKKTHKKIRGAQRKNPLENKFTEGYHFLMTMVTPPSSTSSSSTEENLTRNGIKRWNPFCRKSRHPSDIPSPSPPSSHHGHHNNLNSTQRNHDRNRYFNHSDRRKIARTGWDEGIDTIDSIIDPRSPISKHLTHDQRKGLLHLKYSLLSSTNADKAIHVPNVLLRKSMDSTDFYSTYLVEDFGGVNQENSAQKHFKKIKKRIMSANCLVQKSWMNKRKSNSGNGLCYILNNATDSNHNCEKSNKMTYDYCPREWNVLDFDIKLQMIEFLSLKSLSRWDFNIFELSSICGCKNILLFIGWAILGSPHAQKSMAKSCGNEFSSTSIRKDDDDDQTEGGYNFMQQFSIRPEVLCNFLRAIEEDYFPNPYHNNLHAADVTQTVHTVLQMGGKKYGSDIQIFSLLIASICHDVHHPGHNNSFQVNSMSDLAITYNDISVLENMHASRCFRLLFGRSHHHPKTVDILSGLSHSEKVNVRKNVTSSILNTDMTKHFQSVNHIKLLAKSLHNINEALQMSGDDSLSLLSYILHAADISNSAKPKPMNYSWAKLVLAECFQQGDVEKALGLPVSHLCCRETTSLAESQLGFIQYIVQATFEVLIPFIPSIKSIVMPVIDDSITYWENEK